MENESYKQAKVEAERILKEGIDAKKRPMDISEDLLKCAIGEHMKDMCEKELHYLYRVVIDLKKIRRV